MTDMREIPGQPGYLAGSDGHVYRVVKSKRSKHYPLRRIGHKGAYGYLYVYMRRKLCTAVHVVIATVFHGPKPSWAEEVRHLSGDKLDNRPGNLKWGTKAENSEDKVRHGIHRGALNGRAILDDQKVRELRMLRDVGATYGALADRYGIALSTARAVATGVSWS